MAIIKLNNQHIISSVNKNPISVKLAEDFFDEFINNTKGMKKFSHDIVVDSKTYTYLSSQKLTPAINSYFEKIKYSGDITEFIVEMVLYYYKFSQFVFLKEEELETMELEMSSKREKDLLYLIGSTLEIYAYYRKKGL